MAWPSFTDGLEPAPAQQHQQQQAAALAQLTPQQQAEAQYYARLRLRQAESHRQGAPEHLAQQGYPHEAYPQQGHPQAAPPGWPQVAPQTYAFADSAVMGGGPSLAGPQQSLPQDVPGGYFTDVGGHAQPQTAHSQQAMYGMGAPMGQPLPQPQYGAPHQHGAPPHGGPQPQGAGSYAFPTIGGQQVLAAPGTRVVGHRSRMRWENIVPMLALVACLATGFLVFAQWPEITKGRAGGAEPVKAASSGAEPEIKATPAPEESASEASGEGDSAGVPDPAEIDEAVAGAEAAFTKGNFPRAQGLLHPLLDKGVEDSRVQELHTRVDAAVKQNATLTATLNRQLGEQRWGLALATIGQLEKVRPLTPRLQALKVRATEGLAAKRAAAAAAKKAQAARAANATRQPLRPPVVGGGSTARPPMTSSGATRPPSVPNVPNTGTSGGGGSVMSPQPGVVSAGTTAGSTASNCHSHNGVTDCH